MELNTKIALLKNLNGFEEISICEDCTEAYDYWKNHFNHNKNDCCNLNMISIKKSQQRFSYIGNTDLMKYKKIAFLCSSYVPQEVRNVSKKWASEQCIKNHCIISGFQSEVEKDVLDILIANNGRAIMILPCSIYEKCPKKYENAVNEGRLLIISFFEDGEYKINKANAEKRNKKVIECSDSVVIGYAKKDGMVEKLVNNITKPMKTLYDL